MEIHEIKLINGGFKGIQVYITEERKTPNGRKYIDKDWKEKNDPIHGKLDAPTKDLRKYLLDICGCLGDESNQTSVDYNIAETEITSIKMEKTFFILEGEKEWLNNKRFKLKTPKIEKKDGYPNYDQIISLIETIKEQAAIYMEGKAKITEEEACVRFITSGKDKSITVDDYNNLSNEEKLDFHKKIIEEQFGGIVMVDEDMSHEEEFKEEAEQEEEQEVDLNEKF